MLFVAKKHMTKRITNDFLPLNLIFIGMRGVAKRERFNVTCCRKVVGIRLSGTQYFPNVKYSYTIKQLNFLYGIYVFISLYHLIGKYLSHNT